MAWDSSATQLHYIANMVKSGHLVFKNKKVNHGK